jgi:hypothetical protein
MIAMPRFSSFIIAGLTAALAAIQFLPVPHPRPADHGPFHPMRMAAAGAASPAVGWADFADPMAKAGSIRKNFPRGGQAIEVPVPGKAFDVERPSPSRPAGCEAIASSIADPTLSRLVGRCFA